MISTRINSQGKLVCDVEIFHAIGGPNGIDGPKFAKRLAAIGEADFLNIAIDSGGGNTGHECDILEALQSFQARARKAVMIVGLAASAGYRIAAGMVGAKIFISPGGVVMMHHVGGEFDREHDDETVAIVHRRSGQPQDRIRNWLRHPQSLKTGGVWFAAGEAQELRLVDVIDRLSAARRHVSLLNCTRYWELE